MQEDTCLPDRASVREDLADTVPLAHDDLGCPIRRDRLYQQDSMGATAKPLSGPPVSPSLFRPHRPSVHDPERPSPKAIQASIKESATLAAAISMQWKEEVSAMRRELADLRRDLCTELRAFNSNFNTFTQHYNTWSPQGGTTAAGAAGGVGAGGLGASGIDRGTGGAKGKKPQVSKVSVGTQARSKHLVRQSTADAAVNCPEEKEDHKNTGARRRLPKQLSMDPSILRNPQSMYVESAIPISLDPILPGSVKTIKPEPTPVHLPTLHSPELPYQDNVSPPDVFITEPVAILSAVPHSLETAIEIPQVSEPIEPDTICSPDLVSVDPTNEHQLDTEPSLPVDVSTPNSEALDRDTIYLPCSVPEVTVSPPDVHDDDVTSDSESQEPITVDKPDPVSPDPATVCSSYPGLEDSDLVHPTDSDSKPLDPPMVCSAEPIPQEPITVCPSDTFDLDTVMAHMLEPDNQCPSIVVSEYIDSISPVSPADLDSLADPTESLPDYPFDPLPDPGHQDSTFPSDSVHPQPDPAITIEPQSQEPEWPPLPEPLDTTPIYHTELVHFDIVMLTSLDQDDLGSVFMDPEPEPLDLSCDSPSNTVDLDSPLHQPDSPGSPQPTMDPATVSPVTPLQSAASVCLDPAMGYNLAHMPQDVAIRFYEDPVPQVIVTISPPSPVSPDPEGSLDTDIGPADQEPQTYSDQGPRVLDPSPPDSENIPSHDLIPIEASVMGVSDDYVDLLGEEAPGSSERSSFEQGFLWHRWQRRAQEPQTLRRSASVELWSRRYEYNSAEITYVSLTL